MKRILYACALVVAAVCAAAADQQKPAPEPQTVITGDEMEIRMGGDTVIFTGNSKVTRGDSVLYADRLVQHKKAKQVEAEGNIRFTSYTPEQEKVQGASARARYNLDSGQGELFDGRPDVLYFVKDATGPVHLTAERITFGKDSGEIMARGAVEILSSSACAYSPNARFIQKDKTIYMELEGVQPRLIYSQDGQKGDYTADHITVYVNSKKAYLEGNVHGVMHAKDIEDGGKGK